MGYLSTDIPNSRGELCARGSGCFRRYYKDPENTAKTVDEEGWIHTGDVAEVDSKGRFKIIDRVKNIMKLAQGEYVALEKIENLYSAAPIVEQVYVHGDPLQDYLLAVIVPEQNQLAALASRVLGRTNVSDVRILQDLIRDGHVVESVLAELNKEARKAGLKGFEMVKRIHLSLDPFSVENGTLTPTFKLRRRDAYKKYQAELEALYALGPVSSRGLKL